MFKPGDRVVCINDENNCDPNINLIKYNIYIVKELHEYTNNRIILEYHENSLYYNTRFILLKEYRKEKLKQIELCSNQEIK